MMTTANYIPKKTLTNDDMAQMVETSDEWIYSRTGIKQRHICDGETHEEMTVAVAKKLLEKSKLSPQEIDLLIVATVTASNQTPSTACIVQNAIGAASAFAFDISAACTGFIYGLTVADRFLAAGSCKKAMIIGAEALSTVMDWEDRTTCVLFGDGAGGVILEQRLLADDLHSDGSKWDCIVIPRGGAIRMNGREVFEMATKKGLESIQTALDKAGLTIDDIKYIIPHQANDRIIQTLAKKMKIDISKFYRNIENYGNTSAASVPIALGEMAELGLLAEGDRVLCVAFGGGFTWGSVIMQL